MLLSGLVCKTVFLVGRMLCLDDHDNEGDGAVKERGRRMTAVPAVNVVVVAVMMMMIGMRGG